MINKQEKNMKNLTLTA